MAQLPFQAPNAGAVDQVSANAQRLQELHDQHGSWHPALSQFADEQRPTPKQTVTGASLVDVLKGAAASPGAVGILQPLGSAPTSSQPNVVSPEGLAQLKSDQPPIGRTVTAMKTGSTKNPSIDLQLDHQEPVTPEAGAVITQAEKYLQTPYLFGGADPRVGMDTSGFIQYLFDQHGVKLPRSAKAQANVGQPVTDPTQLQPGDLVVLSSRKNDQSVGLFIGDGQFLHAPKPGTVAKISSLSDPHYAQQFVVGRRVSIPNLGLGGGGG